MRIIRKIFLPKFINELIDYIKDNPGMVDIRRDRVYEFESIILYDTASIMIFISSGRSGRSYISSNSAEEYNLNTHEQFYLRDACRKKEKNTRSKIKRKHNLKSFCGLETIKDVRKRKIDKIL